MHIGQKLRELMKRKGLRSVDVAKACQVSPGAVSNWFRSGTIDKKNLSAVARMIGISSDQILNFLPDQIMDSSGQLVAAQTAPVSPHRADASADSLSPGALQLAQEFDKISSPGTREEVLLLVWRLATRPSNLSS